MLQKYLHHPPSRLKFFKLGQSYKQPIHIEKIYKTLNGFF